MAFEMLPGKTKATSLVTGHSEIKSEVKVFIIANCVLCHDFVRHLISHFCVLFGCFTVNIYRKKLGCIAY